MLCKYLQSILATCSLDRNNNDFIGKIVKSSDREKCQFLKKLIIERRCGGSALNELGGQYDGIGVFDALAALGFGQT